MVEKTGVVYALGEAVRYAHSFTENALGVIFIGSRTREDGSAHERSDVDLLSLVKQVGPGVLHLHGCVEDRLKALGLEQDWAGTLRADFVSDLFYGKADEFSRQSLEIVKKVVNRYSVIITPDHFLRFQLNSILKPQEREYPGRVLAA